ncbi:MAG: hypothetical protein E5W39_01650 [Mesorhizobium sp.]|nr:MAG: hypothetical protein E5W39_01650 [Mesorhizobium sp.]
MRFLAVQEPTNTWAVFDTTVDVPADFAGACLIGLTRERAEWLAARANQDGSVRSNWIGGYHPWSLSAAWFHTQMSEMAYTRREDSSDGRRGRCVGSEKPAAYVSPTSPAKPIQRSVLPGLYSCPKDHGYC